MKIALVNDQHFGVRNDNHHFLDYYEKFYRDVFFPYLTEHNISYVVDLGDTFDRRKYVNFLTLHRSKKMWFDELQKRGIHLDSLVGNHTAFYRNTNAVNSVQELAHLYDNITVYADPCTVVLDGLPILYLPWINQENYDASLLAVEESKASTCFGHLEIAGFEMDRGNICDVGLDRKSFHRFDRVISGHFHHKSTDGKIFYLGTQYELTWADFEDHKGFHVFDTGTMELEFIRNPHTMFHKLWYDDTTQNIEYWMQQDLSVYSGSYIKLIVTNKNIPFLFDRVVDMLVKANPADVQIVEDYGTIYEAAEHVVDQAEDTITILSKYIDTLKIDSDIDVGVLKNMLNNVYIESLHANE